MAEITVSIAVMGANNSIHLSNEDDQATLSSSSFAPGGPESDASTDEDAIVCGSPIYVNSALVDALEDAVTDAITKEEMAQFQQAIETLIRFPQQLTEKSSSLKNEMQRWRTMARDACMETDNINFLLEDERATAKQKIEVLEDIKLQLENEKATAVKLLLEDEDRTLKETEAIRLQLQESKNSALLAIEEAEDIKHCWEASRIAFGETIRNLEIANATLRKTSIKTEAMLRAEEKLKLQAVEEAKTASQNVEKLKTLYKKALDQGRDVSDTKSELESEVRRLHTIIKNEVARQKAGLANLEEGFQGDKLEIPDTPTPTPIPTHKPGISKGPTVSEENATNADIPKERGLREGLQKEISGLKYQLRLFQTGIIKGPIPEPRYLTELKAYEEIVIKYRKEARDLKDGLAKGETGLSMENGTEGLQSDSQAPTSEELGHAKDLKLNNPTEVSHAKEKQAGSATKLLASTKLELSCVEADLESARITHKQELDMKLKLQAEFDDFVQNANKSERDLKCRFEAEKAELKNFAKYVDVQELELKRKLQWDCDRLTEMNDGNLKVIKHLEETLAIKKEQEASTQREPSKEVRDLRKEKERLVVENKSLRKTIGTINAAVAENKTLEAKILSDTTSTTVTNENNVLGQQLIAKTKTCEGLALKVKDLSQIADVYNEAAESQVTIDRLVETHKEALASLQAELQAEKAGRKSDLAICYGPYTGLAHSKKDIGILVKIGYEVRYRNWEIMRAKLESTFPDDEAIKSGNKAAHDLNPVADAAMLRARFVSLDDGHVALFKKVYADIKPDVIWNKHPYLCRLLQSWGMHHFITVSRYDTCSVQVQDQRTICMKKISSFANELNSKTSDNVGFLALLKEHEVLTEKLVELEKQRNGRRHLWCEFLLPCHEMKEVLTNARA